VFLDGASIPEARRQPIARELGFSETVYVDDAATGRYRIFTPGAELPFAGHPTVGTSWLLRHVGRGVDVLRPPAGEIPTWTDTEGTWMRARPEWVHQIDFEQLPSAAEVDALTGAPAGNGSWYAWAWIDQAAGTVRSRYFVKDFGIAEDEATGSAAVVLGSRLGRITIRQGRGSQILVRPGPDGTFDVGGRCVLDEVRAYHD
jgi:predicted PhzF superfamily epimerase YddE/YHI9